MITAIFILIGAGFAALAYAVWRAREGYEDERGYHAVRHDGAVPSVKKRPARVRSGARSKGERPRG